MADKPPSKGDERMRRTERVLVRILIEVKGKLPNGNTFTEKSYTLVVNRNGARICVNHTLQPGDLLSITNLQSEVSCPFRVVEKTTDMLGEGPAEWGVELLEPEVNFWGIDFPRRKPGPPLAEMIDALLECSGCRSRELAQLTLEEYRQLISQTSLSRDCSKCGMKTDWVFGFVEAGAEEGGAVQPAAALAPGAETEPVPGSEDRRRAKRVTVKLPVRICLDDGREEIARTENLSKTGVCFASDLTLKEGETIRLTVGYASGTNEATIPARVMWRRPVEGTNRALYGVHIEEPAEGPA